MRTPVSPTNPTPSQSKDIAPVRSAPDKKDETDSKEISDADNSSDSDEDATGTSIPQNGFIVVQRRKRKTKRKTVPTDPTPPKINSESIIARQMEVLQNVIND